MMSKQCVICGSDVVGHFNANTCSDDCREARDRQRNQKPCPSCGQPMYYKATMCRQCFERMPTHRKPCPSCGKSIHYRTKLCRRCHKQLAPGRYRQKATATRQCIICGNDFSPYDGRQNTCGGTECRRRANQLKHQLKEAQRRQTIPSRQCVICSKEFPPNGTTAKTCSLDCRDKLRRQTLAQWKAANPEKTSTWYHQPNLKAAEVLNCIVCGGEFETFHSNQTSCSEDCQRKRITELSRGFKQRNPNYQIHQYRLERAAFEFVRDHGLLPDLTELSIPKKGDPDYYKHHYRLRRGAFLVLQARGLMPDLEALLTPTETPQGG